MTRRALLRLALGVVAWRAFPAPTPAPAVFNGGDGAGVLLIDDPFRYWTVCPSMYPDLSPEEAAETEARFTELLRNPPPPLEPQIPEWRPGGKPIGRDPEYVRLVAERKRAELG